MGGGGDKDDVPQVVIFIGAPPLTLKQFHRLYKFIREAAPLRFLNMKTWDGTAPYSLTSKEEEKWTALHLIQTIYREIYYDKGRAILLNDGYKNNNPGASCNHIIQIINYLTKQDQIMSDRGAPSDFLKNFMSLLDWIKTPDVSDVRGTWPKLLSDLSEEEKERILRMSEEEYAELINLEKKRDLDFV